MKDDAGRTTAAVLVVLVVAVVLAAGVLLLGPLLAVTVATGDPGATGGPVETGGSVATGGPAATGEEGAAAPGRAGASQSPADAARDGVYPQVAALPMARRTAGRTGEVRGVGGTYVIVRPDIEDVPRDGNACLAQQDGAPRYKLCGYDYAEVLLLSPDGRAIRRAYPFPGIAPAWSASTDDAFWCGRTGDGGLPEGFLCRIDRRTGELTARIYPCAGVDCEPWEQTEMRRWPGAWSQGTRPVEGEFDSVEPGRKGEMTVIGAGGRVTTTVDARTLRER